MVLFLSFFLPAAPLRAASDVTVSTAATSGGSFSGGHPNVFTPTADAAVANQTTIQTSLNAGTSVTLDTASAATGNGDFQIAAPVSKTAGTRSALTLNAVRNLAIHAAISASGGPLPLVLNAGGAVSSSAPIASNGGNIAIDTAQPFTLGGSLNAGTGQILLQTCIRESANAQTVTASTVLNLGGSSQGTNYGAITTSGAVTLAGALQVDFANGFENTIVNGHSFNILSGASFTGLPNDSRITFPNELGSVKTTYTATTAEGPEPVERGTLAWTDTNANSQYDIGEPALPSSSGNVNLGPERIRELYSAELPSRLARHSK